MSTERDLRAMHHALPIGIVLRRSLRMLGIEPFYAGFIAGMEDVLAEHEGSVWLQVAPSMEKELECYERWAASGQIAGVVLGDLVEEDQRVESLHDLGAPTVMLGERDWSAGPRCGRRLHRGG